MTDFYHLLPQEQTDRLKILAAQALELWDIGPDPDLELISHRENAVYKVITAENRYVLRVHRWDYHTDDELRSELQWMAALSQSGIATPKIINTRDGELFVVAEAAEVPEPRQVDLFGWVNGIPISDLTDKGDELTMHRNIGELMAQLHNQANAWTPPEGFTRHSWDVDGLLGENPVWGRFWEMKHFSDEERENVLRARSKARQQLQDFSQDSRYYGLIHCDFLPQNLLKDGDTVRVIDFDDSGFGWHMFDIVTSLYSYTYLPNFDSIKEVFLKGYRLRRELTDECLTNFDFFMFLRLMTSCGWLHTRPETETAQKYSEIAAQTLVMAVEDFLSNA